MSSAMRLSIIMVLLLATAALGLIAYNAYLPKPVEQVAQNTPAPVTTSYLVAAHPLPAGTLARDDDFAARSAPPGSVPSGAILDTPDARTGLRGSLVRKFLDTGSLVTVEDVLRPRDRGFLASVLAPDTRAISINVDPESGVSGLIWPGDYVDVVLTQMNDRTDARAWLAGETVLHNVRIIAIDQDIVQGAQANSQPNNAAAGKDTHTVSLQLTPEQVKKIAVAKDLGKLSLAIRAAVDTKDANAVSGCDVSQQIARQSVIAGQSTTVVVYTGAKAKEYSVKKGETGDASSLLNCDAFQNVVPETATVVRLDGDKVKE
jgi:pilus assembly protein CpaB